MGRAARGPGLDHVSPTMENGNGNEMAGAFTLLGCFTNCDLKRAFGGIVESSEE